MTRVVSPPRFGEKGAATSAARTGLSPAARMPGTAAAAARAARARTARRFPRHPPGRRTDVASVRGKALLHARATLFSGRNLDENAQLLARFLQTLAEGAQRLHRRLGGLARRAAGRRGQDPVPRIAERGDPGYRVGDQPVHPPGQRRIDAAHQPADAGAVSSGRRAVPDIGDAFHVKDEVLVRGVAEAGMLVFLVAGIEPDG